MGDAGQKKLASRLAALERANRRLRLQVEQQQQVLLNVRAAAGLALGDGVSLVRHVGILANRSLAARKMLAALLDARAFLRFVFLDNIDGRGVMVEEQSAANAEGACARAIDHARTIGIEPP